MNSGTISGRALNVKQLSFLQKIKLNILLRLPEKTAKITNCNIPEIAAMHKELANAGEKVKGKLEPKTDLLDKIFN